MIRGLHAMFYSSQAGELRAFFRDKLGLPATDVGGGWLIFDVPDAELGCHPADHPELAPSGTGHISFYCDDLKQTMADLKARGIRFAVPTDPIHDRAFVKTLTGVYDIGTPTIYPAEAPGPQAAAA